MLFFFENLFHPSGPAAGQSGERRSSAEPGPRNNGPGSWFTTARNGAAPRQGTRRTPRGGSGDEPPRQNQQQAHPIEAMFSPEMLFTSFFGNAGGASFAGGGGTEDGGFAAEFFREAATGAGAGANSQPRGPPPCARRVLAQLPRVSIAPADLVVDNNRICSVCLESLSVGEVAVRLPCAHLFHADCVLPWLTGSCVCPVCRYELPTDDPDYERARMERMRHRKPRFYEHELRRLSIAQLNRLGGRPAGCRDKESWTRHLKDQNLIEVIPTPPPAVLNWSELQEMSPSQLKKCMEDNGVFYDPKEVLEKSDLLAVFCNSGRLQLVKDDDSHDETLDNPRTFEWLHSDDESSTCCESSVRSIQRSLPREQTKTTERGNLVVIETVEDSQVEQTPDETAEHLFDIDEERDVPDADSASQSLVRKRRRGLPSDASSVPSSLGSSLQVERQLDSWSLVELRDCALHLAVDLKSCFERGDIVERLVAAIRAAFQDMTVWGACELRAVASVMNLPVAGLDSSEGAVDAVQLRLLDSPRYSFVFSGMSLLKGMSVPGLRALGKSWRVDVSDCLEKAEIMQRLLLHHQLLSRRRRSAR
jgi:Ring finger domain